MDKYVYYFVYLYIIYSYTVGGKVEFNGNIHLNMLLNLTRCIISSDRKYQLTPGEVYICGN